MSTADVRVEVTSTESKAGSSRRSFQSIGLVALQILMTVLLVSFLVPALWMVSSSLKASTEVIAHPIVWIPAKPH